MRDIALSKMTGARIHFQHLSTLGSVQMVREAKAAGLPVTAEATTHHFTLTDSACSCYDPVFKVHPPLRTESDVKAVKEGLADGTIAGIDDRHGMTVEEDNPANLCVVDLDETWTVSGKEMFSRSSNTPYEGWNLRGRVRHTINNGLLVVFDGESTK